MSPTRAHRSRARFARRRTTLAAIAGLVALGASGCASNDLPRFGMPHQATEQGSRILSLWQGSWIAAWAVGGVVWGLIIWAVIFFRRRGDGVPAQTRYNMPIEILYTVVPIFIIAALFFYTARDETRLTNLSKHPDHTINVVGFRWNWEFNYVDEGTFDVGTPAQFPTLYLPKGETVRFQLTSPDVIHSFWVPVFLFKMDVIPGRLNQFEITPSKEGTFAGKCAELCGVDHSRMLFWVKVVSPQAYDQHIAELKAKGQTGVLHTGRIDERATTTQGRNTLGGNH